MNAIEKPIEVTDSALKHGLNADYIERMWYDSNCEGFEVRRLPPRETNVIAIRFLARPDGTLEMIAEDMLHCYRVFHAQVIPGGKRSRLFVEALELAGILGT